MPSTQEFLHRHLTDPSAHVRNRAQIILKTLAGEADAAIAADLGMSIKTIQKWQAAWEHDGLAIFPATAATEGEVLIEEIEEEIATEFPPRPFTFPDHILISPEDTMAEAGRKSMLRQLQRLLDHEPVARAGEDIEGVHKMRVATRRLRSAYRIFDDYLPKAYFKKHLPQDLKRTANLLGNVRDLDILMLKTAHYVDEHLNGDAEPLLPLLALLEIRHEDARDDLIAWLDRKRYTRFLQRFYDRLSAPIDGDSWLLVDSRPVSTRVDHLLPGLIYARFEAVRAYEEALNQADADLLHSLRIEFKRLRYTLEFFEDVLGESIKLVLKETRRVQDHLGELQDAAVADAALRKLQKEIPKPEREGVKAYRAARQQEIEDLIAGFPALWVQFNRDEIREALAQAIAVL